MMPIRFVRYITELYESYQGKTASGKLPAVFPVLLFNGESRWTASVKFADCVERTIPRDYIPQFKYFPILINEIPKKSLERIKNALSAVFYIENSSASEIADELDNFFELIKEESLEVVNLLSYWFNNYLQSLNEKKPGSIEKLTDEEMKGIIPQGKPWICHGKRILQILFPCPSAASCGYFTLRSLHSLGNGTNTLVPFTHSV